MRKSLAILSAFCGWAGLGTSSAAADSAAANDTTIHTTILIRAKASECPVGFTIFQMDSEKKLPPGPKICFVHAAKPAGK
ncbi:MAG: hypothetical protein ACLQL2_13145 [Methylovirgula sp.]